MEEGQRLKVIYGSNAGFHVVDVDSGNPYDICIPSHVGRKFRRRDRRDQNDHDRRCNRNITLKHLYSFLFFFRFKVR